MFVCSWRSKLAPVLRQALISTEQNVLLLNKSLSTDTSRSSLVFDRNYEAVKKQNFGPVLIRDSKNADGSVASSFGHSENINKLYGGIPYHRLPIARISARWNNTIITMKKHDESIICKVSCKTAGFFHGKKKTELAGEMTGQLAAKKATEKGCFNYVRVVMRGIGPGRKSSINGLVLGGMNVVSISDITPLHLDYLPQRPRKIRRL